MSGISSRSLSIGALAFVILLGAALRIVPSNGFKGHGPDEKFYEIFVNGVSESGLAGYPGIFADYIAHQSKPESPLVLPPGRLTFITAAAWCRDLTGLESLTALRVVSAAASIGILLITAAFLWRGRGPAEAIGATALLAFSPLQIHLAQRSLIDGFFAFWAMLVLWTFWECLRHPHDRRWLVAYGASVVALVLTKENAAFVMMAVGALLLANFWLKFGEARRGLWVTTFLAPLLAALILILAAGGIDPLITAYRLNVEKSVVSPYAIATGDGPWFRYLIDLVLLNPAVFLLALIGLGRLEKADKLGACLAIFVIVTFAIMGQLRYGMNARYTNIWEPGLCYFALVGILALTALLPVAARRIATVLAVSLVCLSALWQYQAYFVGGGLYDPVPESMERAVLMIK